LTFTFSNVGSTKLNCRYIRPELARFEVLIFVLINMSVFWVMTMCRLVNRCQNFRVFAISISEESKSGSLWSFLNKEAASSFRISVPMQQSKASYPRVLESSGQKFNFSTVLNCRLIYYCFYCSISQM
jgi:hypothetical protein